MAARKEQYQSLAMLNQMTHLIEYLTCNGSSLYPFFHSFILIEGKQNLFADAPRTVFNLVEMVIETSEGVLLEFLNSWLVKIVVQCPMKQFVIDCVHQLIAKHRIAIAPLSVLAININWHILTTE